MHVFQPVEAAHAADTIDDAMNKLMEVQSYVFTFAHFSIFILVDIAQMVMDPAMMDLSTNGPGMGSTLLTLWQISRNITNILLAFLLIVGAVMTVVFASGEYSKYAVKFVLAVILVNFSWFFPRVILDLSNVLTATVYAIPSEIGFTCVGTDKLGNVTGNCKIITDFEFFNENPPAGFVCPIKGVVCVKEEDLSASANTPNSIMGGLIYNHARLRYLGTVLSPPIPVPLAGPTSFSRLPQLISFMLMMGLTMFFSLAMLFPLLALVVVLVVRIPLIWMTVAFMPFMFIGFVAGDTAAMKVFNPMEMIWKKFLHAAFLPTVVAIPISIGFIMLNVAMNNPPAAWNPANPLLRHFATPLIPGAANIWQLVWMGMAIAVVWIGARTAFKMDEFFNKIATPFMNAGASLGRLLVKLPLLVPLPLPGGATPLSLVKIAANPEAHFISSTGKFQMPQAFGGAGGLTAGAKQSIVNHITINSTVQATLKENVAKINDATVDDTIRNKAFENIRDVFKRISDENKLGIDTTNPNIKDIMRTVSQNFPDIGKLDESKIK